MDFKLFSRLTGDGDEDGQEGELPAPGQGPGMQQQQQIGAGGLERTVQNLFNQGYSQEEIKDELEGQYSPGEIENAVNNAIASSASSETEGPEPMTAYQGENTAVSPMDEGFSGDQGGGNEPDTAPATIDAGTPDTGGEPVQGRDTAQPVDPEVEELVETIVAENFDRVEVEFENVYEEIDEIKEQMEELEQRVHDLEVRDDEDQQQFVQKVDEMEDHIDQYQSRIGGLEKAFQQVLPSLVDNVRDLTTLVQEIKQERGIETSSEISQEDVEDIEDFDVEDWE